MNVPNSSADYEECFSSMIVPDSSVLKQTCADISSYQYRYQSVANSTSIPWWVVGCIHERESSLDFTTYLQNGDPLWNSDGKAIPTYHEPTGVGPFSPQTWENAAIAALYNSSFIGQKFSLGYWLGFCERYNGMGYHNQNVFSPYIWNFTSLYTGGLYTSDGVYDPMAHDENPGVAAMAFILGIKI